MGNVVIPGVQAADEALKEVVTVQAVVPCADEADFIGDVEHHVLLGLNADDAAGFILRGMVQQVNKLLGLPRAFTAHNQANHSISLLSKSSSGFPGFRMYTSIPYSPGNYNREIRKFPLSLCGKYFS